MGRKKFWQSKTNGLILTLSLNHSDSNERLKNMGVKAAFELVGSLGEWMAFHPLPETEVKDGL